MGQVKAQISGRSDKADRLVEAVLDLWCDRATGDISTRILASAASLPTSGIYYHFDKVEHLYLDAQARAIDLAEDWCAAQLALLDAVDASLPAEAFGAALAELIDTFCEDQRRLAFAWRECQILAARDPRFRPSADRWSELWDRFWREIGLRFGLPEAAPSLIRYFFEGESFLHLLRWNRAADRAALGETTRGWGEWLAGRRPHGAPWRTALKQRAERSVPAAEEPSASVRRIAAAAAGLLVGGGVAAVTPRAVASAADMTLGTVSHNCRRIDDLLRLAYAELYRSITGRSPFPALAATQAAAMPSDPPSRSKLLAFDELFIAVARGQVDPDMALQLRYLRGNSARLTLAEQGEAGDIDLLAAIYSSVMMGVGRILIDLPDEAAFVVRKALNDQLVDDFLRGRVQP